MAEDKLTPKQRRFVGEYLTDRNAAQAAIRAGYAHGDSGRQLLAKLHVSAAIAEAMKAQAQWAGIEADTVVEFWAEVMRDASQGTQQRLRASEFLAKYLGMFISRQEHSGPDGAPIEVELSDVEKGQRLMAIMQAAANGDGDDGGDEGDGGDGA
jgi:phage terminase small subunit